VVEVENRLKWERCKNNAMRTGILKIILGE
jgi:hypothetical protein